MARSVLMMESCRWEMKDGWDCAGMKIDETAESICQDLCVTRSDEGVAAFFGLLCREGKDLVGLYGHLAAGHAVSHEISHVR